jgi:hypothetical protein
MSTVATTHEIWLRIDLDHPSAVPLDVGRFAHPTFFLGVPTTLRLAFYQRGVLADVSSLLRVAVELKAQATGGGAPAQDAVPLAAPDPVTALDDALLVAAWLGRTGQHATVEFTAADLTFTLPTAGRAWLVIALEHADLPGIYRVVSAAPCTIALPGFASPGVVPDTQDIIDGGTASSIYETVQSLDGGGAAA